MVVLILMRHSLIQESNLTKEKAVKYRIHFRKFQYGLLGRYSEEKKEFEASDDKKAKEYYQKFRKEVTKPNDEKSLYYYVVDRLLRVDQEEQTTDMLCQ